MSDQNNTVSSSLQSERKRLRACRAVLAVAAALILVCAAAACVSVRGFFNGETTAFLKNLAVFSDIRNENDAAGYQTTIDTSTAKIDAETALQKLYADRDAAATDEEKNGFSAAIAEAEAAVRTFFATDEDAQAAYGNLAGVIKKDNSALTIATNKLAKIRANEVSYTESTAGNLDEKQSSTGKTVALMILAAVISALLIASAVYVGKAGEGRRRLIVAVQIVLSVALTAVFITTLIVANGTGFTKYDRDNGTAASYASMAKQADKADLTAVTATEAGKTAVAALDAAKAANGAQSYVETFEKLDDAVSAGGSVVSYLLVTGLVLSIVAVMTGITLFAGFIHVRRIVAYTVLGILSFLCLFFFYLLMINCTRTNNEIISGISLLPGTNFKANWDKLMAQQDLPVWYGMLNSLIISLCTAGLSTYVSALTAYAIHAYDFRFKNFAFSFILLIMMIPTQVSTLGFIDVVRGFGWTKGYSSFLALIVPSMAAPTVFFFMKQYMDSALPLAIVEASRIDGSSEFGTFNRIVLPIMKPAIAVQAIFCFVNSWNNYFVPALVISGADPTKKTLPILIATLRGKDPASLDQGMTYMMIALSILPVIIVYLCLSKFIIRGVALGGVKE